METLDTSCPPIVAAADGSDLSCLAIAQAATLAHEYHRGVVVGFVRSVSPFEGLGRLGADEAALIADSWDARRVIAMAQAIAILDSLRVQWTFSERAGRPADQLMTLGEDFGASLIVVASHGRRRLRRFQTPSVSRRLMSRWPRSLLIASPMGIEPATELAEPQPIVEKSQWFNRSLF